MTGNRPTSFGWIRDLPDPRDFNPEHPRVLAALRDLEPGPRLKPKKVDLSEYFPPIDDQGTTNACAAHACAALVEYFERRSSGSATKTSRRFLYRMSRQLAGRSGDCGADLRTTLKAIARFGLPPERLWAHEPGRVDDEPPAFLFAFADDYRPTISVRLDPTGASGERVLQRVKGYLAAGFPSAFGFSVFESLTSEASIPFPTMFDVVEGGATAVSVGYEDSRRIRSTKGALRIRCSWGEAWGESGYGWLPYAYVLEKLAVDFWTTLRPDWLSSREYVIPDD